MRLEALMLGAGEVAGGGGGVSVAIPSGTVDYGAEHNNSSISQSLDFGSAEAGRQIFVGVAINHNTTPPTLTAATIGGVSATTIATAAGTACRVYVIAAAVPTGTSGTISLTYSGTTKGSGFCVWRCTGLTIGTAADTASGADTTSLSGSIDCTAGGVIFGVHGLSALSGSTTWGGVTANKHAQFVAGSNRWGGGVAEIFASTQTGLSVSATIGNSSSSAESAIWAAVDPA